MTVAATVRKTGPTPGNSAATVFPFAYKVFLPTDLLVQLTIIATGVTSTLVLNDPLGYTVALNPDQNANPGGSITYNPLGVPMPATQQITITSAVPQAQGTHIVNGGSFFANNVEDAVDKVLINVQDQAALIASAVRFPVADSAALTAILPPALQRANQFMAFDAAGNVIASPGPASVPVTGAWAPVVQSATLALGRAAMGFSAYFDSLIAAATAAAARLLLGFSAIAAKGDLFAGSAANTIGTLTVGTDGQVVTADSASALGLKYVSMGVGSVRQSVQQSVVDANGYANFLTTGAGLRPGLSATAKALIVAFAAGFGSAGAADLVSTISADVADPLGANLPLSNTSLLHASYTSPVAVAYGTTLVPPQYGYAFDKTKQSLLLFEGANGAGATTDDFGNAWALTAATLSNARVKFGATALSLAGGGKYASTTDIHTLGDGSWETSFWFNINALPGVGVNAVIGTYCFNVAGFGLLLQLINTAGTSKLGLYVSSDSTSWNVANNAAGTNTVWALNQYNRIRVVFDALAGNYKVYLSLNGAAETTDITVASTARVCAFTTVRIGADTGGTSSFDGYIDAFRILPCATNTSAETPSVATPTLADYPVHLFSVPEMKMYEVTAASAVAGTNPTMTARNRVFLGEADTSGAAVTAVRSYALRGMHLTQPLAGVGINTIFSFVHNLGVPREFYDPTILGRFTIYRRKWSPLYAYGATQFYRDIERDDDSISVINRRNNYVGQSIDGGVIIDGSSTTVAANFEMMLAVKRAF